MQLLNTGIEWLNVTPSIAEAMLIGNTSNRRLNTRTINRYAADMREGRWRTNAIPIQITSAGRLIDGQHRLHATIRSGCSVRFLVIHNAPEESFDVIDQGQPRNARDVLEMEGVPYRNVVAAAARLVILYKRIPGIVWIGDAQNLSRSEIIDFVRSNLDVIVEAATIAKRCERTDRSLNTTVVAAAVMLIEELSGSPELLPEFIDRLTDGVMLEAGDPRLALRNYFARSRRSSAIRQTDLGATIKAWNAFVEGRPIAMLRFHNSELPMPKIV